MDVIQVTHATLNAEVRSLQDRVFWHLVHFLLILRYKSLLGLANLETLNTDESEK